MQNVSIVLGSSAKCLESIISSINEPITFWLDAHNPDDKNLINHQNPKISPVMEEIIAIKSHPIKTHTILIDDVRQMGGVLF